MAREGLSHWHDLIAELAREFEAQHGSFAPFAPTELASLVSSAFVGAEALILLGYDDDHPVRTALRRVGEVMAAIEARGAKG